MADTLMPRVTKKPDTRFVQTDCLIDWVSREKDGEGQPTRCRIPEPGIRLFPRAGFIVAGTPYPVVRALTMWKRDEERGLYTDIYGRHVLLVKERFPCFDSNDDLYEDRYCRWAYLIRKECLICVYWKDEGNTIEVTEDVRVIKERAWKAMEQAGVIQNGILML